MIANNQALPEREQRLEQVLVECLEELETGRSEGEAALRARYPEFAAEVAELVAGREKLDRLVAPLRAGATPLAADPTTCADSPSSPATPPEVGRCFGDYELLEEIARGGMGVVYRARQKSLNRVVALKMILAGELASVAHVQRFRAEAEAVASLDHAHVVPIYEIGEGRVGDDGPAVPYFTMKLIDGPDLTALVRETGARTAEDQRWAAGLLATIARAVHYAHQRGILHRDLKPRNVLLDAQGQPYVSDFGLAKRLASDQALTQPSAIVGTPGYLAPEQAAGGQRVTTAADVYSLGAILYELLTGRPPFQAETPLETLLQAQEQEPVRPGVRNPRVDRDLETICLKCLERDPQRRYGSAEALADDLERWQAGEAIQARRVGRVERSWRWCRRNPVVAGLSAAVLLVAGVGLLGVLGQWQVALANEREATANALQAQEKEQEANQQRDEAQQQRDEAQRQRDEVRVLNDRLQRTLYAAHMNLAHNAWEASGVVRVQELLEQHRPKPGESDLRGFEWHYLYRLCHAEILTLKGHSWYVNSVAFSPDGKRLASGGSANEQGKLVGEAKVWDAQSGQVLLTIKRQPGGVNSVVFSPDGKRLASAAGDDKTVKVWDAQTGQELLSFKGHSNAVNSVVFSPDGKRLASASWDGTVKVWDAQTDPKPLTLKGAATSSIASVAFSPDGKRLASGGGGPRGSGPGALQVWDAQTGQEIVTLQGHTAKVTTVAYSPDGKRLASGSGTWDWTKNAYVAGDVKVWDALTGQELLSLKGHTGPIYSVAFSPDGKRLASGSGTLNATKQDLVAGEVKVWDAQTGQEILTLKGYKHHVNSVAFSPDGKRLASAGDERGVTLCDAQTGQKLLSLEGPSGANRVAFSPDGKRLAGAGGWVDPWVKVWDAQTGQELLTCKGHTDGINSVAFSPDGKRLASAGGRGGVTVSDALTGQELLTLQRHADEASSVAFSPNGHRLASGGSDGTVTIWDATPLPAKP